MLRFLLDTNIISEPARPAPDPAILARLRQHRGEIAIPCTDNLILATRNVTDFAPFAGLQITPWRDPPTENHP